MRRVVFLCVLAGVFAAVGVGRAEAQIGDSASGSGTTAENGALTFDFSAAGGPGVFGTGASGTMSYDSGGISVQGTVICMLISGVQATVVGQITTSNADPQGAAHVGNYMLFFVEDNGPVGVGQDTFTADFGGVSSCQGFHRGSLLTSGDITVFAAPAPPVDHSPATVSLDPPDGVNDVGTTHTVTATVADAGGAAVQGTTVLFNVEGADSATGSCTTGADGKCSFSYTGPTLPGADLITACADANQNGAADPAEPCGTATEAWLLPTSTPGSVTGGGQVLNASGTDEIAFGFKAKNDSHGVKGECNLVDPSTKTKIKCLDVTTLVETGTHATLFGNATVNGIATTYRIDVDDNGEPGRGRDTFRIQTASGYSAGGTLTRGNVEVH